MDKICNIENELVKIAEAQVKITTLINKIINRSGLANKFRIVEPFVKESMDLGAVVTKSISEIQKMISKQVEVVDAEHF